VNIDSKKKGKNETSDEKKPHHGRRSNETKNIGKTNFNVSKSFKLL
jgi:hypothetical protein